LKFLPLLSTTKNKIPFLLSFKTPTIFPYFPCFTFPILFSMFYFPLLVFLKFIFLFNKLPFSFFSKKFTCPIVYTMFFFSSLGAPCCPFSNTLKFIFLVFFKGFPPKFYLFFSKHLPSPPQAFKTQKTQWGQRRVFPNLLGWRDTTFSIPTCGLGLYLLAWNVLPMGQCRHLKDTMFCLWLFSVWIWKWLFIPPLDEIRCSLPPFSFWIVIVHNGIYIV
jgi:hypothetical protein